MNDTIKIKSENKLSLAFFNNAEYSSMLLDNPKIFFDEKNKEYTLVSSFLIDRKKDPANYSELKPIEKEHIGKIRKFVDFYNGKSKQKIKHITSFHFPSDSELAYKIITVSSDESFNTFTLSEFSEKVNQLNSSTNLSKDDSEAINNKRQDNTSNGLFSAILNGNADNSLHIDKILHLGFSKQALFFTKIEGNKTPQEYLDENYDSILKSSEFTQKVLSPVLLMDKDSKCIQVDNFSAKEYSVVLQPKPTKNVISEKKEVDLKNNKNDDKNSPQMNFKF